LVNIITLLKEGFAMRISIFRDLRKLAAGGILKATFPYAGKDPGANLPKLLRLAKLAALQKKHRRQIDQLCGVLESNPVIYTYAAHLLRHTHPNIKKRLLYNWLVSNILLGVPEQQATTRKLGVNVPNAILVDPTSACNLRCEGCWAGKYPHNDSISPERLDRLFREAKELGIHWIVFSGGEPLLYPRMFDLLAKHPDIAFMAYTNGTLIDEKMADRIVTAGNFTPAISLEGWRERTDARRGSGVFDRVTRAMDLLRQRGAIFGVSLTATRYNVEEITSDAFIDFLVKKGVSYGWIFHYIPIGRNPNLDMMVTPEQRAHLAERIAYIRSRKAIMLADFWNDGALTDGCIAGGRRYFHINAAGEVEPCAFVHFAVDNINNKSLLEVLCSPLFAAFQKRQPFNPNHLRPCPIIDNPEVLREIVCASGARPTHAGAEAVLEGTTAAYLDRRAAEWGVIADGFWEARTVRHKTGAARA
jgi:MoaA/NifB/PqqE/SkfB family radical SAM enzyme